MRRYYYRRKKIKMWEKANFNPEISRGMMAILLFVVGGLATLAFFDLAGVVGKFLDALLALIFGQIRYIFPLVVIIIAIKLIRDLDYEYRHAHWAGVLLFFLGFNGLIHSWTPVTTMVGQATQGYGGGLLGLALAWPLGNYVGFWGAIIILIGLTLAGLILIFNTTLTQIIELHRHFFRLLGWAGQQIINFFSTFKTNQKLKTKIINPYPNEYHNDEPEKAEDPTSDEYEAEEQRLFSQRALNQQATNDPTDEKSVSENDEPNEIKIASTRAVNYRLPPLDLLTTSKSKPTSGDIKANAEIIKDTFQNFGIEVEMGNIRVGPTVTQYSLKPAKGVKLTRITTLSNDLALALAAHPIRIEAPIPGQSLVGIEVPNQKVALVTLRELLESQEFKTRPHNIMIALGKDVAGKVWVADLPKMPHLLIAGATGSGKTVCINTVILSLLYQNTPETLRFIMVDPKRVELTLYNGIPHLLTPVITDAAKTVNALKWAIGEMDRRFDVLAAAGKRDILSYNKTASEKLPYIVFVIDELADLMAMAAAEVEAGIIRIAQMARAVGIHLIVATQRPSVEVITGLMKANIPARIAFSVASIIDSRTILDCPGADKLLGRGDMLFLTADLSKPKRLQAAFISEEEMKTVVEYIKGDEPPEYNDSVVNKQSAGGSGTINLFGGPSDDQDSMFEEAKKIVIESGKASASLLQRRLRLGYARAARILDELEEAGVVGPADGAKPREVYTEHLMPSAEPELTDAETTLDAGGIVLNDPEKDTLI